MTVKRKNPSKISKKWDDRAIHLVHHVALVFSSLVSEINPQHIQKSRKESEYELNSDHSHDLSEIKHRDQNRTY